MRRFRVSFRAIRRSDRGAAAIEYALLACFIGLGIVAGLKMTKSSLNQDLNLVTASVGKVSASIVSPKKTVSQVVQPPFYLGTVPYFYEVTTYDDGSKTYLRRALNNPADGYQVTEIDPTGFSPLTTTVTGDGRVIDERSTYVSPGVTFVEVSESGKSYSMLQTVNYLGNVTTVNRVVTDPGTMPGVFQQYQAVYVSEGNVQNTVGTRTVAQNGTVTTTGQSIASYF